MEVELQLDEQTILITGAAGAIGLGIAKRALELGARVFLSDLDQARLDACCAELDPSGERCAALAGDVCSADQVERVVAAATEAFGGRIDILLNVAGMVAQGAVEEIEEAEWDRVFAVNCKGTFLFIREVVPLMKAQGAGSIVNFSSKSGKTGSALLCHYSAAKAAIIGLTQALAYELASSGIRVNCVCPGITEATGVWDAVSAGYIQNLGLPHEEVVAKFTSKVPLQRLARVADVAAVTLFLASEDAAYMTGQAINVTGGREMH